MKNRIDEKSKSKFKKITIELLPEDFEGLEKMAGILGSTPERTAAALLSGMPEDFLHREEDPIWLSVAEYLEDHYRAPRHLKKLLRHLYDCQERGKKLGSILLAKMRAERQKGTVTV